MALEHDIKQNKFTSEYQKLVINIAYTNGYLTNLLNNFLKPYGLSMQQYNVLRILRGQHPEPVSINSITDRMIDKMSNASRLVAKLQLKSMVARNKCAIDRRQVDVCITSKGLDVLAEIDEKMINYENQFSHIDIGDAQIVNRVLDELRNNENF